MKRKGETTRYRFIACPECNHQFSWLGSRLPNYCPECGVAITQTIRADLAKCVLIDDDGARVSYASTS